MRRAFQDDNATQYHAVSVCKQLHDVLCILLWMELLAEITEFFSYFILFSPSDSTIGLPVGEREVDFDDLTKWSIR